MTTATMFEASSFVDNVPVRFNQRPCHIIALRSATKDTVTRIGTSWLAHVSIDEIHASTVSEHHASIIHNALTDSYTLEHASNTFPTFLNGVDCLLIPGEKRRLASGDILTFGESAKGCTFRFSVTIKSSVVEDALKSSVVIPKDERVEKTLVEGGV